MTISNKTILVMLDYYLPGVNAGGPITSIHNLVTLLGQENNFKIVTRDRDINDINPYPGISADTWVRVDSVDVFYASPSTLSLLPLLKLIRSIPHDTLYLNSFFSMPFTIIPLVLKRAGLILSNTILAPRGELNPGALVQKKFKKQIYLKVAKFLGLYQAIVWQASSELEKNVIHDFILKYFGSHTREKIHIAPIIVAPDLPSANTQIWCKKQNSVKEPGSLKIVFVGRISPMKNIDFALKALQGLRGDVTFDLYGPLENVPYWERCKTIIQSLSPNICIEYCGPLNKQDVCSTISKYDLFFMPTLGENFGHVIFEALSSNTPVLISNRTPWQQLSSHGIGWDLPLEKPESFTAILQECINMSADEFSYFSNRAKNFAFEYANNPEHIEQNRRLFNIKY